MTRVEWYLTRRLRAKSLPLPQRGQEDHGRKPARILWQVLARGSDGCPPESSARAPRPTLCTPAGPAWDGALPRLAGDGPGVDWPPGLGVLEQSLPCGRHQLGHELGSGNRPHLISMPRWPAQLRGQALLGGTIETMIGTLERQRVSPLLVLPR